MSISYLARGMYRNRNLLDLAHRVEYCQNCGAHRGGCDPAHSNLQEHGRGKDLPSHDCFFAALCNTCHRWLDHGRGKDPTGVYDGTREDKTLMFRKAMDRTWLLLWQSGWLKVV